MNCKRIRKLISTDYIDGRLSESLHKALEAHLDSCTDCRVFAQTLREKVSRPLKKIHRVTPPEEIWQRIKEAIRHEQTQAYEPSLRERLWDLVSGAFLIRKPVFALATSGALVLAGLLFLFGPFRQQAVVKDYLHQQSEYMLSLNKPVNGELDRDTDFGTPIEQYLF